MKRREFIAAVGSLALSNLATLSANEGGYIMTVAGVITPDMMGACLTHEHALVDFIGADLVSPARYDAEEAYQVILPYLKQIKELGCQSFVDATPAFLGRDVKLLQRLSSASDLHILTNTGYYGAANDKYLPKHAFAESADQLAERWLKEWNEGIDGTDIKPGFIKIGVDSSPLSEIDKKIVIAAARASRHSGLPVASHTGDTRAGLQQLDIMQKEGGDLSSFIWVHAQNDWNLDSRIKAAKMGAWISLDNVSPSTISDILMKVKSTQSAGVLEKLLLSHDAGWYAVGEAKGGVFRSYDTLFTLLLPAMTNSGITPEEINQIIVGNPRRAFSISTKTSGI